MLPDVMPPCSRLQSFRSEAFMWTIQRENIYVWSQCLGVTDNSSASFRNRKHGTRVASKHSGIDETKGYDIAKVSIWTFFAAVGVLA